MAKKYKVNVQVGQTLELVVSAEDQSEAEEKAMKLAKEKVENDDVLNSLDFDIESAEEVDDEEETDDEEDADDTEEDEDDEEEDDDDDNNEAV